MSDDQPTIDLAHIARQQRQILDQLADMRADNAVSQAVLTRLDATVAGLMNEMHAQLSRLKREIATLRT